MDNGGSEALRRLVRAGRSEVPSASDLRSLQAKLGPILDPPPGGGSGGEPGPDPGASGGAGAAGTSLGTKLVIGAGLLAAGTALVVAPRWTNEPSVPPPSAVVVQVESPATATASVVMVESAPIATATASAPPAAPRTSRPSAPSASSASGPDPVAEAKLLRRAQDALSSHPSQALALCSEHARLFPRGLLSQEREVIRIQATAATGRRAEAKAEAERFRQAHPHSAYLRRLEALLGPLDAAP